MKVLLFLLFSLALTAQIHESLRVIHHDIRVHVADKEGKPVAGLKPEERAFLKDLLARCDGNITKAARFAKMQRTYLHKMLARYKDDPSTEESAHAPNHM